MNNIINTIKKFADNKEDNIKLKIVMDIFVLKNIDFSSEQIAHFLKVTKRNEFYSLNEIEMFKKDIELFNVFCKEFKLTTQEKIVVLNIAKGKKPVTIFKELNKIKKTTKNEYTEYLGHSVGKFLAPYSNKIAEVPNFKEWMQKKLIQY